ncbi:MAG: anti-sigma factor [Thermoleophilaceae bacterium]
MNGHEHTENVGAYLLGALPELEVEVFERHVMGCASCRDEVERLRPAAEALPRAVPQLAPPAALREAIMQEVRGEAAAASAVEPAREPRPRRPSLRLRPAMAWVSAAFIILAGVLAGYGGSMLLDDDDGARTLSASVDQLRVPEAGGSLIVPGGDGEVAVLSVHGLRETIGEQVYVVWSQRGNERVFESSFNVRPDGSGRAAITDIEGVDLVMVTRERSAGVRAPGEEPILTVETG